MQYVRYVSFGLNGADESLHHSVGLLKSESNISDILETACMILQTFYRHIFEGLFEFLVLQII